MDAVSNPYSPGAGRPPHALVGRDEQLRTWDVLMTRASRSRIDRSIVLHGLRGVGKTVLLRRMHQEAENRDWISLFVEVTPETSLGTALTSGVAHHLADAQSKARNLMTRALGTFRGFTATVDPTGQIGLGINVSANHRAATGDLDRDLPALATDLGAAAAEKKIGVSVMIDEMQDLSAADKRALCTAVHQAGQAGVPFFVVGAGLPSLPRLLSEARSYAERLFLYHDIGPLVPGAAREALTEPAMSEGVGWEDDALDLLATQTNGYPYFIQEYGQAAWGAAAASPITLSDARVGIARGNAELDAGFFRSRWERATPSEREYLAAMATDGAGPSASGELARRLNRPLQALGPARANLISKGLVYSPEHGRIAFTVPGMADFITRQS